MSQLSQEWLTRRLATVGPRDFEEGIHMYCTSNLTPPPQFEHVWTVYEGGGQALTQTAEEISALHTIIIFSSPIDEVQVAALCRLVQKIDGLGHDAPPILWVPHTVAPDSMGETWQVDIADSQRGGIVTHLLKLGLDGMVPGELAGARLALAVRAKIHKLASLSRSLNEAANERRSRAKYADHLKECIDVMLWEYMRARLAPTVPPIDYKLPAGDLKQLDCYNLGSMLGRGAFGSVYKLHLKVDQPSTQRPQVVKVVSKASVKDLADLSAMRNQIDVMMLLSSDRWAHPNLVQLYQTYHSTTHLFFRMEFGGPENLYQRLQHRQKKGAAEKPLSLVKVIMLLTQIIAVVTYIHLGPHVCRRDLKPENIIVQDLPTLPFFMKLADFDLAAVQQGNSMFRTPSGTVPFTAPEVLLQGEYRGMSADVWSLGIVMLEVLCGLRIVEKMLSILDNHVPRRPGERPDDSIGQKIRSAFSAPGTAGSLLEERCRSELQSLIPAMKPFMVGMLNIDPKLRWTSEQLLEAAQQSLSPPGLET
mmetsp:Transcript_112244/g.356650  ORF Transcript_112244/g.356650 Transcript_112244/m.356650 type:complete len:533 (-) Transcript_112244:113-1711(-)